MRRSHICRICQCVEGSFEQLGCHDGASECSRTLLFMQGCDDVEVALCKLTKLPMMTAGVHTGLDVCCRYIFSFVLSFIEFIQSYFLFVYLDFCDEK